MHERRWVLPGGTVHHLGSNHSGLLRKACSANCVKWCRVDGELKCSSRCLIAAVLFHKLRRQPADPRPGGSLLPPVGTSDRRSSMTNARLCCHPMAAGPLLLHDAMLAGGDACPAGPEQLACRLHHTADQAGWFAVAM